MPDRARITPAWALLYDPPISFVPAPTPLSPCVARYQLVNLIFRRVPRVPSGNTKAISTPTRRLTRRTRHGDGVLSAV